LIKFYVSGAIEMERTKAAPMIRLVVFHVCTAIILAGCIENTHDFKIRFDSIQDLREGAPVLLDETVIGSVKEITYDSGDFLVSVAIEKKFASATTDASKFFIDNLSESGGEKVVRVIQTTKKGSRIEDGAVVEGQSKYAVIYGQFASQFRKNLNIIDSELNAFFQELKTFSDKEQINKIEKKLSEIIADLGNMSAEMKQKIETEILPFIKRQIDELRRRLEKTGEEEKLIYVDEKVELISVRLRS
jgi:hypothetical protein